MPTPMVFDLLARDQASTTFKRVGDEAVLAATKVGKATTAVERAGIRMGAVGGKLSKALTLPIVAAAAVAVDQATKYQSALNTIQVATDASAKQMATSSAGLMKIAKGTGTSLDGLTQSLYTAEKGGLRGAKALDVVRVSAQGAAAEGADLGTATQALTSIMASYGKSLGSPVQAENALIRGAGLAKTSYEDFAASLSNVIPLASSLHISFAQVAGAVDAMTQHGETAQRSTENLSNLITALAGQNNVASQAMQQLGINTTNLQKNLGTNGLTGTLQIVENALASSSKGGMVVVDSFKNAQKATASIKTELDAMPPSLQSISKAFDTGKMSYLDYNSAIKALGGQQYALGKGFIQTEQAAHGFSNQLRSGNGDVSTAATQLQKMLGGVTGMRVALMLGGNSAKTFAADTSAIADAANKAGTNVLGWSKTQDTFSVKMDRAKEAMQVLAVETGTALLPALSKLATAGTKAIGWVDGLDHTQKEVLGWGLGIAAGIGPALSITGRLLTAGSSLTSFTTSLAKSAGASEASAARIGVAAGRIGTAVGAAGLGLAVGELTKNSSTAVKSVGVLGSALSGAALGASAGPWGAAIGAAAGAVGDLGTMWLSSGTDAQKASAAARAAALQQKQAVDSLYQSLVSVNGAYGAQYKHQVINQLISNGALRDAQKVGKINPQDVVGAALGNTQATSRIYARLNSNSFNSAKTSQAALNAGNDLVNLLRNEGSAAHGAQLKYELYMAAQGKGVVTQQQLSKGVGNIVNELRGSGTALTNDSRAWIAHTAYAARNTQVIHANIDAVNASAVSQLKQGKSVSSVADAYVSQIGTLSATLHQMGFNQAGAQALINTYGKMPTSVATNLIKRGVLPTDIEGIIAKYAQIPSTKTTTVTAIDNASNKIRTIVNELGSLHNKTLSITTYHLNKNGTGQSHTVKAVATGGIISGPGTGTSDTAGVFALSNGEAVIPAKGVAQHRGLVDALISAGRGMAQGGVLPGHVVEKGYGPITTKGKTFLFAGQSYDSLKAAQAARRQATSYNIGGQSYTTLAKAVAAITNAFGKAEHQTLGFGKAAEKGGSDLKSSFNAVLGTLKLAGITSQQRAHLVGLDNAAAKAANQRIAAAAKVAALRSAKASEIGSIHSAVTGSFAIASAGTTNGVTNAVSLGSITAQTKQAELIAKRFASGLIRMGKEGYGQSIIEQIAQQGTSAYPQVQALLQASPKRIAQLNRYEAGISKAGRTAGGYVATRRYGDADSGRIGKARDLAHHDAQELSKKLGNLETAIKDLAKAQREHPTVVDMHIDSTRMATAVARGNNQNTWRSSGRR